MRSTEDQYQPDTQQLARHLLSGLIIAITLVGSIAGFNFFIDPLALFGSHSLAKFNQYKTEIFFNLHTVKPYHLRKTDAQLVFLGSSRAGGALNPAHSTIPAYNFSMPGASLYQVDKTYDFASHASPMQQVLISLDFFMFDANNDANRKIQKTAKQSATALEFSDRLPANKHWASDSRAFRQAIIDHGSALFTFSSLKKSFRTITKQQDFKEGRINSLELLDNGFWRVNVVEEEQQKRFRFSIEKGVRSYCDKRKTAYALTSANNDTEGPMALYEKLLRKLHRQGIDANFIILPVHALHMEVLRACHIWPIYIEWKRQIIEINERVAEQERHSAFDIWDFTSYNKITTESLPKENQSLQWYYDVSHPNEAAGEVILAALQAREANTTVDNFGLRINSGNFEAFIGKLDAEHQVFKLEQADEVNRIASQAKKILTITKN